MYSESNSTGCLDLLAIIVESPTDDRLGSVFVCGSSRGRKRIGDGIVELFVVGPVWAARRRVNRCSNLRLEAEILKSSKESAGKAFEGLRAWRTYFATFDMFVVFCRMFVSWVVFLWRSWGSICSTANLKLFSM